MARQIVVLALVLFAVFGLACAADSATNPLEAAKDAATEALPSEGPTSDDQIGNSDEAHAKNTPGGDILDVVEGPIGGPESAGATGAAFAPGPSHHSAATPLQVSAGVAVAAVAGYFF
ncbi:hypothetical protein FNV43_RR25874 [Rhamnella rubrinervis]|uniref:Anther-specific protein BCP1-like n=1 Tax=Rhamnella rubrinervis TaxID=2594499 RepID=A0A8K0DMZ6_9ROSA|nr:hypothetical protein FNV43_RR25874 [Rhamnella rubrinervis]